jgi:EpsI family protein
LNRRDLLMGGGMLAAAGAAFSLTPRKRLVLLGEQQTLDAVVPKQIADWTDRPSEAFILPKEPGSLADRLYNQTLTRLYVSDKGLPVMLVIAYGAVQNDQLQLHRPEVCYQAVGFEIASSHARSLELGGNATLPVRTLEAVSTTRVESILYWTRIGDDLPTDGGGQRMVKLRQQMAGYLADGVLVRMSSAVPASPAAFAELSRFATAMVAAISPADRDVLIGRQLAAAIR